MKKSLVVLLLLVIAVCFTACGKSKEAKNVESLISEIGTVSLDSEEAIVGAEEAYDALSDEDKSAVESYQVLVSAREDYEALKKEAEEAAKKAEAIANVENLISKITAADLANVNKINEAKKAYDELPEEDQAKVKKGTELLEMVEGVKALKQKKGKEMLSKMRADIDKVRGYGFYYPSAWKFYDNDTWAADQRCFVLPYIGCENDRYWLRLVFNFTDDDWVFFEKVTVAADDERFYKYFSYYDVTRDNGGGDVWEYVDIEVGEEEIDMLWAIVNSKETIVRFEGDEYTHDFTINANDKKSIKAVLEAYEMLS